MSITLYVGNLTWECNDDELFDLFVNAGTNPHGAEVIFGRKGRSQGYGLATFNTQADADAAMQLNDTEFQGRNLIVRPDRGPTAKAPKQRKQRQTNEEFETNPLALFVGNLAWETTEEEVIQLFPGATSCSLKLGRDGRSRGFAVCTFDSEDAATSAMNAMQGYNLSGRELLVRFDRVGGKKPRKRREFDETQSTGCSVFVGNLAWSTSTETLKEVFSQFNYVNAAVAYGRKGERSRGYGTVLFNTPEEAQNAIQQIQGVVVDERELLCKIDMRA